MPEGWQCPQCRCVWAPSEKVCSNCFPPPATALAFRPRPVLPQSPGAALTVGVDCVDQPVVANTNIEAPCLQG